MNAIGPGDLVRCVEEDALNPGFALGRVYVVSAVHQSPFAFCDCHDANAGGLSLRWTDDPHQAWFAERTAWCVLCFVPIHQGPGATVQDMIPTRVRTEEMA